MSVYKAIYSFPKILQRIQDTHDYTLQTDDSYMFVIFKHLNYVDRATKRKYKTLQSMQLFNQCKTIFCKSFNLISRGHQWSEHILKNWQIYQIRTSSLLASPSTGNDPIQVLTPVKSTSLHGLSLLLQLIQIVPPPLCNLFTKVDIFWTLFWLFGRGSKICWHLWTLNWLIVEYYREFSLQ